MNIQDDLKYFQEKANYFSNIGFDTLANDFLRMVNILLEIQNNTGKP